MVNSCPHPIIKLIMKDPSRGLNPSFCENRGTPMHKQKKPLIMVPKIIQFLGNYENIGKGKITDLFLVGLHLEPNKTKPNRLEVPV